MTIKLLSSNIICIIAIICVISIACVLFNKNVQYLGINYLFSNVAPITENETLKTTSDKVFYIKHELEEKYKKDISSKCALLKINTYNYNDIKDDLDNEMFKNMSFDYTQPVLIKKVFNDEELKIYNFRNLQQNYGNIVIEAIKYTNNGTETIKVPFSEYLDRLNNGEQYYMTVNNSLANALDKQKFMNFNNMILKGNHGFNNMFIGNKNSSTHLHSEIAASCATQISGVKKWYIIDPKWSKHLNPIPDKNNIYFMSIRGFIKNYDEKIEKIPRFEVICDIGDFLFVPPWFWHETLNLTNENIMLSYRPSLFEAPYRTNPIYTINGIKNSIGFNNLVYPYLVSSKLLDPNKDTVIDSIKEIDNRIPEYYKKKLISDRL